MGARDCTRASVALRWNTPTAANGVLQWGRPIVRAQAFLLADRQVDDLASMGARDCTRASVARAIAPGIFVWLQWGRAIVRAQARRPARGRRACDGFNGGARLYARKRGVELGVGAAPTVASMGARDCTRASADVRESVVLPLQASMGARDCTRASRSVSVAMALGDTLQWGRAIVRAQARRRHGSRHDEQRSFNGGARLYARKRRTGARNCTALSWASMGARDCTRASPQDRTGQLRAVGGASMGARDCTRASGRQQGPCGARR